MRELGKLGDVTSSKNVSPSQSDKQASTQPNMFEGHGDCARAPRGADRRSVVPCVSRLTPVSFNWRLFTGTVRHHAPTTLRPLVSCTSSPKEF